MVFLDRSSRKNDPWLGFKVGAFVLGAVLAFAGIYLRQRWLIWVAIGVLLLGFAARFMASDEEGGEGTDAVSWEGGEQQAAGEAGRDPDPVPGEGSGTTDR